MHIARSTGMENDGVHLYDNMTGINWSKIPVFILEMGYMTNKTDDTNMQDEAYQKKMVAGIADGIDDYFGFKAPDDALAAPVEALVEPQRAKGERWAVYAAKAGGSMLVSTGSQKMQAASLIKLYIMGAVCENYEATFQKIQIPRYLTDS